MADAVLYPSGEDRVCAAVALGWLDAADRERETTLNAIFTLHCRLLEALYVTDFRLGKAYGLGRALAETSLVPARADGDGTATER